MRERKKEIWLSVLELEKLGFTLVQPLYRDEKAEENSRILVAALACAAAPQPAVTIPAGYALIPAEPTEEMVDAAYECEISWPSLVYRAMLNAAPQPPVVSADELVAAEREACALVCDRRAGAIDNDRRATLISAAMAIRARGAA